LHRSKTCAYIQSPTNDKSKCANFNGYVDETISSRGYYDTKIGLGLLGFIKTVYFWDFAKTLNTLSYSPRKNFPLKDRCSPFKD
jgi:hypothetical protein